MREPKYVVYASNYKEARSKAGRLHFSGKSKLFKEKERVKREAEELIRTLKDKELDNILREKAYKEIVVTPKDWKMTTVTTEGNGFTMDPDMPLFPETNRKFSSPELRAIQLIEDRMALGIYSEAVEKELESLMRDTDELIKISEKVNKKAQDREDKILEGIKLATAAGGLAVAGYAAYKAFEHFWLD